MGISGALRFSLARISHELFSAGAVFSVYSLTTTFCIAIFALIYRQKTRRGRANLRAIVRAIFSKSIFLHRSSLADLKLFVLSVIVMPPIMVSLVVSTHTISMATRYIVTSAFGEISPLHFNYLSIKIISTVVMFIAYEIGYWVDHYLKHKISFLWEFHKLHHTAEVLTPLTNFRNHPIDNLVFGYTLSVFIGCASGLLSWIFSRNTEIFSIDGKNIIFIFFLWTIGHLQHSQFWIPFPGSWGRLIMSPAHHQIHHSNDFTHFNRNMGSVLAVWDWMFGTLEVPSNDNPRLSYGVKDDEQDAHSAFAILAAPLFNAALAFQREFIFVKDFLFRTKGEQSCIIRQEPRVAKKTIP